MLANFDLSSIATKPLEQKKDRREKYKMSKKKGIF